MLTWEYTPRAAYSVTTATTVSPSKMSVLERVEAMLLAVNHTRNTIITGKNKEISIVCRQANVESSQITYKWLNR